MQASAGIYEPRHSNFGDQWATINLYLHMSLARGERIRVHHRTPEMGELHREIVDALDSPGQIELTPEPYTVPVDGYTVWATPYFPAKRRWQLHDSHPHVTIQVDGLSSAESKNPSPQELARLAEILERYLPGVPLIPLGKHFSVAECVELAAASKFFLGVDSGMAHLCHSVGVPIFMLEYGLPVVTCHRGKSYRLCRGSTEFAGNLQIWLNYLQDLASDQRSRER